MEDLDETVPRFFAVLDPLKIILTNYPESKVEIISCPNFPKALDRGSHSVPFSRVIYIDRSDFREVDVKGFKGNSASKLPIFLFAFFSVGVFVLRLFSLSS